MPSNEYVLDTAEITITGGRKGEEVEFTATAHNVVVGYEVDYEEITVGYLNPTVISRYPVDQRGYVKWKIPHDGKAFVMTVKPSMSRFEREALQVAARKAERKVKRLRAEADDIGSILTEAEQEYDALKKYLDEG